MARSNSSPTPELSDLILVHASPSQRLQMFSNAHGSWGSPATVDQYISRKITLSTCALTCDGGAFYWVLVPRSDPGTLDLCAHCETIRRRVLVARRGEVKEGDAWNVAAVYCPPEKRRRGYAGRMMQLLGEIIKRLNAEASCLWSDIGEKFYAERGWRCFESLEGTIAVTREEERDRTSHVEDITDDNIDTLLAELTARDVTLLREEISMLGEANPDSAFIAVLPSISAYRWYFCRSEHDAIPFGVEKPTRWGATVAVADSLSFIAWIPNIKLRMLVILRLRAESSEVRRALLRRAVNEAFAYGFTKVVVWGTETKVFEEAGVPCTVGPRMDSLSSMAWYGGDVMDVVWVNNEKYAWC